MPNHIFGKGTDMKVSNNQAAIIKKQEQIWKKISKMQDIPVYPAIVQQVLITAREEEFYD